MRQVPDRVAEEPASFEDAERLCEELGAQVERARKVLRDYRAKMGPPASNNDNRPAP